MQNNVENDLINKKCEIINSLVNLIESRTNYRFDFDLKFIRPEAINLDKSFSKKVKLSSRFLDEYLIQNKNFLDNFSLTRGLINSVKATLLNNFSDISEYNEKQDTIQLFEPDGYVVELVEELNESDINITNNETNFIESMSKSLLDDSFNIIKQYNIYAENLLNEILNDIGKENLDNSSNEKEIEIKIKLPHCISDAHSYFQRRHSADVVSFNLKSGSTNPPLPNIVEDCLSDNDYLCRRHSLNVSTNKLIKSFNKLMPIIIVDFEDELDGKSSSRSSLEKSRLSDSENEITNNQFKQYNKVMLKNLLNKSPIKKKNKNENLNCRIGDSLKEISLQNSQFCKNIVEEIVTKSINTVQCIIK